jgi:hypothetical protein
MSALHHLTHMSGQRCFLIPLPLPVFQILFQYYNTLVYLRFVTAFLSTKKAEN